MRDREGRAGAGRDRGGRRDGRAPGAPFRRVRGHDLGKGKDYGVQASPRRPVTGTGSLFPRRVPFPGSWEPRTHGKRRSVDEGDPGARPGPAPGALAARPRPGDRTPSGRPGPARVRHAPPLARRALALFRNFEFILLTCPPYASTPYSLRPNRLRRVRARSRKSPLSEWAFSLVRLSAGAAAIRKGKPRGAGIRMRSES